jgi:hypothetical protein
MGPECAPSGRPNVRSCIIQEKRITKNYLSYFKN